MSVLCVYIAYIMGGKVLFMAAATAVDTIPHCDFALISAVAFYLRSRNLSMLPAIRGWAFLLCRKLFAHGQCHNRNRSSSQLRIALLHCQKLKQATNKRKGREREGE